MARLVQVVGISAAVLLLGTAAQAAGVSDQHRSTAVVGGYGGYLNSDLTNAGINQGFPNEAVPILDAEAFLVGIDALWNGWHGDSFATQLDFNAQVTSPLAYDPEEPTAGQWVNGAVHVAYRNPELFAVGAFGAAQRASYEWDALGMALAGAEGQAYLDDLTIYLQAGVAYTSPAEPVFNNYRDYGTFAFVRGVLRGFARERRLEHLGAGAALELTRWADGRLSLRDPVTGREVQLDSFGPTNSAAFAALLAAASTND